MNGALGSSFPFPEPLAIPSRPLHPDDSLASKPPFPPPFSSCSPNFGHKGACQALNCGPLRPMRGSTGWQGASDWVGREARRLSASSSVHLRPSAPWMAHSPQGFHQKRNQLGPRPSSYSECRNLLLLLTNTQSPLKILDIQHN